MTDQYLKILEGLHTELEKSYNQFLKNGLSIEKNEYTTCLMTRMTSYYNSQYANKNFLEKRVITSGADFFTEQLLFCLKVFFAKHDPEIKVVSEKAIIAKRNAIRPDISIWRKDKVIAIIECKTQLGWSRGSWENNFNERTKKLNIHFKKAKAFLVVLTGRNWGGFEQNELLGKKYFCLLNKDKWVNEYKDNGDILTPIEGLLNELKALV